MWPLSPRPYMSWNPTCALWSVFRSSFFCPDLFFCLFSFFGRCGVLRFCGHQGWNSVDRGAPVPFHPAAEKFRQRSPALPQQFLTIPESQALNVHVYKHTHEAPPSIRQVPTFVWKSMQHRGGACARGVTGLMSEECVAFGFDLTFPWMCPVATATELQSGDLHSHRPSLCER